MTDVWGVVLSIGLIYVLYRLEQQRRLSMSQFTDLKSLIGAVKTATDEEAAAIQGVSDRIDRILASIPADGMNAEQVAELKQALGEVQTTQAASIERLTALGKDPENPVPGV